MHHFASGKIGKLAQEWTPDTVLILANYLFFKRKTFSRGYSDPLQLVSCPTLPYLSENATP